MFSRIYTKLDSNSSEFLENTRNMQVLVKNLHDRVKQVELGGSEAKRRKYKLRKRATQPLPRARIRLTCDLNAPFLEISPLAALGLYDDAVPSTGLITGIGRIRGIECMIMCNDVSAKGGSYFPLTIQKYLRAQEISLQNRLPCVYFIDSRGINLFNQDKIFSDLDNFGRILYNQANMSALGIAQITVIIGYCAGSGAYIPAMSDETIIVEKQGTICLNSPALVKALTKENISPEELGGGYVHTKISGIADYLGYGDIHALWRLKMIIAGLNYVKKIESQVITPRQPEYAAKELYGIVPADPYKPFDMREIIMRIVDGSAFEDFKEFFGTTLVCVFAYIEGIPVGILANNGIMSSDSAHKGTEFIKLCCRRKIR
jgi:3-methylcrotonyl-CoA carboxylase beta subunit